MFCPKNLFAAALIFASSLSLTSAEVVCHDETFVPDAILRITEAPLAQSCLPSKPTVLVNGTSPGPALRLKEGTRYWIRVYNDMSDKNLTMHWHGLSMATSPFSDGTPLASQWPIPPSKFFDYEILPPTGMAGTYFYHSHVGFQAVSATGPLIVTETEPPYKYDAEKIVFLQDVFTKNDSTIEKGLVSSPLQWSGETSMILVNGKGAGSANGTSCNASLAGINVEPGKTYRLRFIGGTALSLVSLAIEGHNMTVIEADGSYTEPHNTSFLQIGSGQRYSVLLHTNPTPEKKVYYMQLETRERPTLTRSFAVLNYGTPSTPTDFLPPNPATIPLTLPNITRGFLDYELSPHHANTHMATMPTADQVTRTIVLTVHQKVDGRTTWVQNSYPWTEDVPKEPYLVSLYKNNATNFPSMERALANNGIDPETRTFPAQIGEVLEIVIQNTGADKGGLDGHPFHAHGAHYWDLGAGNGTYNATQNNEYWASNSTGQPIKRDTTMLYRYASTTQNGTAMGWRAWRIEVTQPGVWMVHCHILQHMIMGMQTVWVMGNASEVMMVDEPEVEGYLTYGGDVLGDENSWPSVVEVMSGDDWTKGQ
ncbi:related to laccase precursor [Rhynchosporium agropyri]|uniref:Related to laccase n=1 Tax=Rhynchosporium agropyri TaxID=914238 RepID=A0A1E1LU51_9HELO|nr:related to laccase precursor [Rhynchosporium agropyri]